MTSTAPGTIDAVRDWIVGKHPERSPVDQHIDLIENRLIDSLSFVEFVFVIEKASGTSIDVDTVDIDDFRTLSAIEKAFFPA
ncbi:acyl carrier protein [Solihabitans fulvus]|uniref:Acyl carrier protein n=1 Tax=Solihabitans fulvus TaxID=1892852 RepID=A0A5B2WUB0_9PSEU|nr:acyl carrier protein [Solihabitans fulvus]KAA2255351.1 acyl carrier protein [Solihabitans fulvus]